MRSVTVLPLARLRFGWAVLPLVLFFSTAARADIVSCMWDTTLPDNRVALVKAISEGAADEAAVYDGAFDARWRAACRPKDEGEARSAKLAFSGYAVRLALAEGLATRYGVTEAQLIAAWNAMPDDVQKALGHTMVQVILGNTQFRDADIVALGAIADGLGVRDADGIGAVASYYLHDALYKLGEAMLGDGAGEAQ